MQLNQADDLMILRNSFT